MNKTAAFGAVVVQFFKTGVSKLCPGGPLSCKSWMFPSVSAPDSDKWVVNRPGCQADGDPSIIIRRVVSGKHLRRAGRRPLEDRVWTTLV